MKEFLKKLISEYYEIKENVCGGNLHIMLDDGNLNDRDIIWCYDHCEGKKDYLGMLICSLMIQVDETDRQEIIDTSNFEYSTNIDYIEYARSAYEH